MLNPELVRLVEAHFRLWMARGINAGNNTVTEISHIGTLLSGANGYSAGGINVPSSLAIDTAGNVWIANMGNSTVTELNASGGNVAGSPFSGGGLSSPGSISFDGFGNAWLTNTGAATVSEFSSSGTSLSGSGGFSTGGAIPLAIAVNPR